MEQTLNRKISNRWNIFFNTKKYPIMLKLFSLAYALFFTFLIGALMVMKISPNLKLSGYGIVTTEPFSIVGLFLISILILNYIASWSIAFETKNATQLGLICVKTGIVCCIFSMFLSPFLMENFSGKFPKELIFLLPIYFMLTKNK